MPCSAEMSCAQHSVTAAKHSVGDNGKFNNLCGYYARCRDMNVMPCSAEMSCAQHSVTAFTQSNNATIGKVLPFLCSHFVDSVI